ncbi:hypothetical protein Q7P35_005228 [Cladosporium inversicolor]
MLSATLLDTRTKLNIAALRNNSLAFEVYWRRYRSGPWLKQPGNESDLAGIMEDLAYAQPRLKAQAHAPASRVYSIFPWTVGEPLLRAYSTSLYKLARAGIESRPDARAAAPWMHRAQTGGLWLVFALDRLCHGLKACKPRSRGDESSQRDGEQSLTRRLEEVDGKSMTPMPRLKMKKDRYVSGK